MSLGSNILKEKNIHSFANQITQAILGFISFIILTRTFSKEIFGAWVLYVAGSVFIEMFRFGLTRTALIRFLSGAGDEEAKKLKGSNWVIGIVITLIFIVVIFLANIIFHDPIQNSGYRYFFKWYPVLALVNLPLNNAIIISHAEQRFERILVLRSSLMITFVLFLLLNLLFFKVNIETVIIVNFSITALISLLAIIKKWDGLNFISYYDKAKTKQILDFGKFSTGTLIGSNLLKSADTFIIGLSPFLGTAGVALYSVPLKLTEIMEIPLRSFTSTAFPRMSKASIANDNFKVKQLFYANAGGLTLLFIPLLLIAFIFAENIMIIIGGHQYVEAAWVFRLFCFYGLILPADRFTGVALDSLNKPKLNFYKIIYMTSANIVGDLLAVFVLIKIFPNMSIISVLMAVAGVTIFFTLLGLFVGWHYTNKEIGIEPIRLLKEGYWFYRKLLFRFKDVFASNN